MQTMIQLRDEFFKTIGQCRIKRIAFVTVVIAGIWVGVDYFAYDNVSFNLKHDLIALGLGVVAERLLPWGKSNRQEANR